MFYSSSGLAYRLFTFWQGESMEEFLAFLLRMASIAAVVGLFALYQNWSEVRPEIIKYWQYVESGDYRVIFAGLMVETAVWATILLRTTTWWAELGSSIAMLVFGLATLLAYMGLGNEKNEQFLLKLLRRFPFLWRH
jgi:hypothetical protein